MNEEIKKAFLDIFEYLKAPMIKNLIDQGHTNTERLLNSIDKEIRETSDFIAMDGTMIFYGQYVDRGRRAGLKRVPIAALEEWIKQKGFVKDVEKVRGVAFAIQKTIFDKGISQPGTWKGESTKGFFTNVFDDPTTQFVISDDLDKAVGREIDIFIANMVSEANALYRSAA